VCSLARNVGMQTRACEQVVQSHRTLFLMFSWQGAFACILWCLWCTSVLSRDPRGGGRQRTASGRHHVGQLLGQVLAADQHVCGLHLRQPVKQQADVC
jgi:hypothetical protein